ncbi:hypothetical protein [Calidifontibacillus erzurumensis]|uniref:Uncharacterized protein n=1 Tax=Calidifontibacillus erzurumensis TaxID=2741433 RepID=A0A8J8GG10_9BACI|nr:hypothetical protein [Calidifontibacillus erzurumensis]NSL52967.1 hypothetical protein [Calidifontibacillus erzurumensis]
MYKVLYTKLFAGQRLVHVMDFNNSQIIEFTMDELEKDELTKELKMYIEEIKEQIDSGYFDYDL